MSGSDFWLGTAANGSPNPISYVSVSPGVGSVERDGGAFGTNTMSPVYMGQTGHTSTGGGGLSTAFTQLLSSLPRIAQSVVQAVNGGQVTINPQTGRPIVPVGTPNGGIVDANQVAAAQAAAAGGDTGLSDMTLPLLIGGGILLFVMLKRK